MIREGIIWRGWRGVNSTTDDPFVSHDEDTEAKMSTVPSFARTGLPNGSFKAGSTPLADFAFRPHPEADDIIFVIDPNQRTDCDGEHEKFLALLVDNRNHRKESKGCERAS